MRHSCYVVAIVGMYPELRQCLPITSYKRRWLQTPEAPPEISSLYRGIWLVSRGIFPSYLVHDLGGTYGPLLRSAQRTPVRFRFRQAASFTSAGIFSSTILHRSDIDQSLAQIDPSTLKFSGAAVATKQKGKVAADLRRH